MNKIEIWKDIKGYKGLYQISNLGRVKSLARLKNWGFTKRWCEEIILNQHEDRYGYLYVELSKMGKKKYKVHRLVGIHFVHNPENKPQINHLDEIKSNNYYKNLQWATAKENNNYGDRVKKIALKNINGTTSRKIKQYNLDGSFIKEWPSMAEAGRNGFCNFSIGNCVRGLSKTHKGYIWKYKINE